MEWGPGGSWSEHLREAMGAGGWAAVLNWPDFGEMAGLSLHELPPGWRCSGGPGGAWKGGWGQRPLWLAEDLPLLRHGKKGAPSGRGIPGPDISAFKIGKP